MRKPIPFAILVLLGVGVDLLTKWYAFRQLSAMQYYVVIPNILDFVHAENHGVAFSMLAGRPGIIITVTSLAIAFIIWMYSTTYAKAHTLSIIAMNLLLIGAIGNLIDRVSLGYVRDFIDFVPQIPIIGHWAVFNVADIAITIGVILFAIAEFFFVPKEEKTSETQTGA
ncbi:MAG: signal peptidase II [Planctomycetota bacterium]